MHPTTKWRELPLEQSSVIVGPGVAMLFLLTALDMNVPMAFNPKHDSCSFCKKITKKNYNMHELPRYLLLREHNLYIQLVAMTPPRWFAG